jgi:sugar phosphate isomerase/epimerase
MSVSVPEIAAGGMETDLVSGRQKRHASILPMLSRRRTMDVTRRMLLAGGAAGLTSAVAGSAFAGRKGAAAKASSVHIGVQTYSFRDRPLDEAMEAMKKIGIRTCELWQGHFEPKNPAGLAENAKTPRDRQAQREALRAWRLKPDLMLGKKVAGKFKKAGVELHAVNISLRDDFVDGEIDYAFRMARAMGARVITSSSNQQTVARFAPAAARYKLRVGVHNHSNIAPSEFATPDDFEKAISGPGREYVGINLDIGHFTAANFDSLAFLEKHHRRIVTLHIKDRKKNQGPAVPFGEGDAPIQKVLAMLRDRKWDIRANIEFEYKGDPVVEVQKLFDYCQQAVAG